MHMYRFVMHSVAVCKFASVSLDLDQDLDLEVSQYVRPAFVLYPWQNLQL